MDRKWLGLGLGTAILLGGALVVALAVGVVPRPVTYVVVKGDTLWEIARANEVTVTELREWNGMEGDIIEVGQVLLMYPQRSVFEKRPVKSAKMAHAVKVTGNLGGTSSAGKLSLPAEKKCLAAPSMGELEAEEGYLTSQGLDQQQIRSSMNGFINNTLSCISGSDDFPEQALWMEITVACTGRVASISINDQGDWSNDMANCVTNTLKYAPFPAHDLPDGEVFAYPLKFTR